jgi:hypothetical protein
MQLNKLQWWTLLKKEVAMVLGGPKIGWSPWTQESRTNARMSRREGTKNPRKPALASKVVNPLTRALAPPFIGRRRDFYIPRLPSNLENIPNENMYKNVFYISWFAGLISYIYKSATSSHFKPGLFEIASLTWLPRTSEISCTKIITHWDSQTEASRNSRVHDFMSFTRFQSSWNRQRNCEPKPTSEITSWNIKRIATHAEFNMTSFMNTLLRI